MAGIDTTTRSRAHARVRIGAQAGRASFADAVLRSQTDVRLLSLARQGHVRGFDALVARHLEPLLTTASPLVGDDRATDIVEEAAMRGWRDLRGGAEVVDVTGWLHCVVRRTAWDVTAGPAADSLGAELAGALDPRAIARRRDAYEALVERISGLPDVQREAVVALVGERCTREAPGGSLALSGSAVVAHGLRGGLHSLITALTPAPAAAWAARRSPTRSAAERVAGTLAAGSRGLGRGLGRAMALVLVTGAVVTGLVVQRSDSGVVRSAADRASHGAPLVHAPATTEGRVAPRPASDVVARAPRRTLRPGGGPRVSHGAATTPTADAGSVPVDPTPAAGGVPRPTGTLPAGEIASGRSGASGVVRSADGVERGRGGAGGAGGAVGRGPSISPGSTSSGSGGSGPSRPGSAKPSEPGPKSAPPAPPTSDAPGPSSTPAPVANGEPDAPSIGPDVSIPVVAQ
jgi:DNA-directed RNA polymerase specialized sigma24 family protein